MSVMFPGRKSLSSSLAPSKSQPPRPSSTPPTTTSEPKCYMPKYVSEKEERDKMTRWKRTTLKNDDDEAGLSLFTGKAIDAHSASAVATYSSVDSRVKSKVFAGLNVKTKDSPSAKKGFTEEELEGQYDSLACVWKKVPKDEPSPIVRVQSPAPARGGMGKAGLRPLSRGALDSSPSRLLAVSPLKQLKQRPMSSALKSSSPLVGITNSRPLSRGSQLQSSSFASNAPEPPPLTRAQVMQPVEETVRKMQQDSMFGSGNGSWGASVPFTKTYDSERKQQEDLEEMRARWVTKKETASGHAPILIEDTPMMGGLQRAWATADVQLAPFKATILASGAPAPLRQSHMQLQQIQKAKQELARKNAIDSSSSDDDGYGGRRSKRRRLKTDRQTSALVKEIDRFEGTNPDSMLPAHYQKTINQPPVNTLDQSDTSRPSSAVLRKQAANNPPVLTFDESSDEDYFVERQAAKDALEQSLALRPVALGPNGKPLKPPVVPAPDRRAKYVVEKKAKDSLQQFNALMGQQAMLGASLNMRPNSSSTKLDGGPRRGSLGRGSVGVTNNSIAPPDLASIAKNPSFANIEGGAGGGGGWGKAKKAVGFQSSSRLNRTTSVVVKEPSVVGPYFYATDAVDIIRELYKAACPSHQDREDAYVQALGGLSFPMTFKKFKELLRRLVHQATGGNAIVVAPGSFAKPSMSMGGSFVYEAALASHSLSTSTPTPQGAITSNGKQQARLVIPDDVYRAMYTFIVEKAQSLSSIPPVTATHGSKHTVGLPAQLSPVIPYVGYLHGVAQCVFSPKQLGFTHDLYQQIRNSPHINYYLYHLRHRVFIRTQRRITKQLKLVQRIHALTDATGPATSAPSAQLSDAGGPSNMAPNANISSMGPKSLQKDSDNRSVDEMRDDLIHISTEPQRLLTLSAGLEFSMLGDPIEEGAKARLWYQKRNYLLLAQHAEQLAGEMNAVGAGRSSQNGQGMGRSITGGGVANGGSNKTLRKKTEEEILDEALRELERKIELIQSSAADTFKTNATQGRAGEIKDQLLLSIFLPKKIKSPPAPAHSGNSKKGKAAEGGGRKGPHQGAISSKGGANKRNTFEIEGFSFDVAEDDDSYSDADSDEDMIPKPERGAGTSTSAHSNGFEPTKFATFVVRDVVFNLKNVSLQFPHPEEDAFVNAVVQCLASTALDTATALVTDEATIRQRKEEELKSKAKPTTAHSIAALTGDIQTCAVSETEQGKQPPPITIEDEYKAPLHPPPLSYLSLDDFRMLLFCDDRAMAALELVCPASKTVVDGVFAAYR